MTRHAQLWHFTCDHSHDLIGPGGELRPGPASVFLWLTDIPDPDRTALGLASDRLACDRTAHRYRVLDDSAVRPYVDVRLTLPEATRRAIEGPGTFPLHWFVSTEPVPAVYDPWTPPQRPPAGRRVLR